MKDQNVEITEPIYAIAHWSRWVRACARSVFEMNFMYLAPSGEYSILKDYTNAPAKNDR